jgi:hypothetical protein
MEISRKPISRTTRFRDAHRSSAELDTLLLTRELAKLADRFPQHKPAINRLWWAVRFQLRKPHEQEKLIQRALARFDILGLEELAEETGLNDANISGSLARMIRANKIELCSRDGGPYRPKPGARLDALGRQLNSLNRVVPLAVFFRLTSRTIED